MPPEADAGGALAAPLLLVLLTLHTVGAMPDLRPNDRFSVDLRKRPPPEQPDREARGETACPEVDEGAKREPRSQLVEPLGIECNNISIL